MEKYQVTIYFTIDEEFMNFVPEHRNYINQLIESKIIDHYAVSMDSHRSWIIINAKDKHEVTSLLQKSSLFKYWKVEIDKLFVYDGVTYRLPTLVLN